MTTLHDIHPEEVLGFLVHARNIHTGELRTYGPFPGQPSMTYEFLRSGSEDVPDDDHIFVYTDPIHAPDPAEPHWIDSEGDMRNDGWQRCRSTEGQFGIPDNDFWTDLSIEFRVYTDETPVWERNELPA